jgi:D-serine deaminase-like pyridoxal phosphate-dependent protein
VRSANQEHGVVARRDGVTPDFDRYPVGTQLRVLPNHACATAAQHGRYQVVHAARDVIAVWDRINGW